MKSLRSISIFIGINIILWGMIVGCGKSKRNNSDNYAPGQDWPYNNPPGTVGPGNFSGYRNGSMLQQAVAQTPCTYGGQRFGQMSFISQGGNALVQQGHAPSQGAWYAGVSQEGDLVFIQEINQGIQIRGYNVILSLCTEQNQLSGGYIIGPGAQLGEFSIRGVTLTQSPQCSIKKVGYAEISFRSSTTHIPIHIAFAPLSGCF